jgi:hypothetical protein
MVGEQKCCVKRIYAGSLARAMPTWPLASPVSYNHGGLQEGARMRRAPRSGGLRHANGLGETPQTPHG